MFRVIMTGIDVVHLLLATLIASVLGVELAISVMFSAFVVVVVELMFLVEFVLVVFVVETCNLI